MTGNGFQQYPEAKSGLFKFTPGMRGSNREFLLQFARMEGRIPLVPIKIIGFMHDFKGRRFVRFYPDGNPNLRCDALDDYIIEQLISGSAVSLNP